MTAVDPEYQRHYQFWIGFTRFMKIGITFVVTLLILMAIFLV
jgi:Ni,Fe-hydrogenase I cytochrome b subunit